MPWKDSSLSKQRLSLVQSAFEQRETVRALAQRFGVSRKTAYKWIARHAKFGLAGVQERSHATVCQPQRLTTALIERIIALRHAHPSWGAKKLRTLLALELGPAAPPAERTIARWLARGGLCRQRPHRARPGPLLARHGLQLAQNPNDVWTVDFKGAFRTADGQRCEPLTVRDLFSRMVLAIEILPDCRHATLRAAFLRLFQRFGLPATIRVDNGQPFASPAPYGCSILSLWWMRLHIAVNFTRPGCPQDNASHEQFHRVYKNETLRPPARCLRAQKQRHQRWLAHYNTERPHEALGQRPPACLYRKSPRRYRKLKPIFAYPLQWKVYRVGPKGTIRWRGRIRLLSRILAHERVGLCPTSDSTADVYIEKILMGNLHTDDLAGMRPVTILPNRNV
jgi:transposase InsO family protein